MQTQELAALLRHPNLHEISARAHAVRFERHGLATSFPAIDHLDLGSGRRWCPMCGADGPFSGDRAGIHARSSELHLLFPEGTAVADRAEAVQELTVPIPGAVARTILVATLDEVADTWDPDTARALAGTGALLTDGVHPRVHPAHGPDAAGNWAEAWRIAGAAGLRGHTSILYGPHHDDASVLEQISAVAGVQAETGVFLSVAPLIFHPESFGGVQDNLLTHGGRDLRVLAAVRLGLPDIPHVRVEYNRSDLKLAHISLTSGADDVAGHLHLDARDRSADADAFDLSLDEMPAWLREVGFAPMIRNARYETAPAQETRTQ